MKAVFYILSLLSASGAALIYSPASPLNPVKGFIPYQTTPGRTTFPHTVSVMHIPLNQIMYGPGPTNFVWTNLDNWISQATNEHCQFSFRIYLDFPQAASGIPRYLIDGGLVTHAYTDFGNTTSVSPNWEDVNLRKAMTNCIAAIGARYDGDPRISWVELGFLGLWAQWWDLSTPFASLTVQEEVMNAHIAAFSKTQLLLSPNAATNSGALKFGWYDDAILTDTLSRFSNGFLLALTNNTLQQAWQTHMIGGEIDPALWYCQWSNPACGLFGFQNCLTNGHFSWSFNSGAFSTAHPLTTGQRAAAMAQARLLGYELFVNSFSGNSSSVTVTVTNIGVAPFYYPWLVQFKDGATTWNAAWNLTNALPNRTVTNTTALPGYTGAALQMRMVNPMAGGVPFCFANSTQDTNTGWVTLGSTISPTTPTQLVISRKN